MTGYISIAAAATSTTWGKIATSANRNRVIINNQDAAIVLYITLSITGVTPTADATPSLWRIAAGGTFNEPIAPDVDVWIRSASGTPSYAVAQFSI